MAKDGWRASAPVSDRVTLSEAAATSSIRASISLEPALSSSEATSSIGSRRFAR